MMSDLEEFVFLPVALALCPKPAMSAFTIADFPDPVVDDAPDGWKAGLATSQDVLREGVKRAR